MKKLLTIFSLLIMSFGILPGQQVYASDWKVNSPFYTSGEFTKSANNTNKYSLTSSLDDATGDEYAFKLNTIINKTTSGDVYSLRINITDTSSPGSIIPFSISDNSLVVKDGDIIVGGNFYTSLTTGSISFIGSSGLLTEDNSNLFWDDTNKRLGIGGSLLFSTRIATAFGDSITNGVGASDSTTTAYVPLLNTATGYTFTNYGTNGDMVPNQTDEVYGTSIGTDSLSTIMLGTNDERHYQTNIKALQMFREGLAAEVAWLAIPDARKKTAFDSSLVYTGTWINTVVYGIGKNTAGTGSITAKVSGAMVMIGTIIQNSNSSYINVTIDGYNYGQFNTTPIYTISAVNAISYMPRLLIFPNLREGEHTVIINATGTAGNNAYFDWIAGSGGQTALLSPSVYVANVIRMTSAGYASYGGSDDNVYDYSSEINSVVTELAEGGLNVTMVDTLSVIDITTDISSDGIHPNDAGHLKIKNAFISAMQGTIYPRDRQKAVSHIIRKSIEVWTNPETAVTSGKATQFDLSTTGALSGIVQPDYPRNLVLTVTDVDASITVLQITVSGILANGIYDTEVSTSVTGEVLSKPWAHIDSITVDSETGGVSGDDTLDIGFGVKFGLSESILASTDIYKININNADSPISSQTINTRYKTIIFSTTPDGIVDYQVWYIIRK